MTAVEWLYEKLMIEETEDYWNVFTQAKEMERQQQGYSEEEVLEIFEQFQTHLPLHYEFLVKEYLKKFKKKQL